MNALRNMYGLRRVCLVVVSLILSASTIHLLNLPAEPSTTNLNQGLHDLQAMAMNHTFAGRCVDIVRSLATKWSIGLPEGAASISAFRPPGQRTGFSPTSSTFWAASFPGHGSSRSSGSSSSVHESPFPPPTTHVQSSYVPAYADPASQMEMQNVFWTPFPGQTMPVPTQLMVPSMPTDMTGLNDAASQWQTYQQQPGGMGGQQGFRPATDSSTGFQDWQWHVQQ
jgi:hypothetical protein